jgi:hypothetical protein
MGADVRAKDWYCTVGKLSDFGPLDVIFGVTQTASRRNYERRGGGATGDAKSRTFS